MAITYQLYRSDRGQPLANVQAEALPRRGDIIVLDEEHLEVVAVEHHVREEDDESDLKWQTKPIIVKVDTLDDEQDEPVAAPHTETEKDSIIRSLAAALKESMLHHHVFEQKAPYKVPHAIQHDLWLFTETTSQEKAINLIKGAIENAAAGDPNGDRLKKTRKRRVEDARG